MIVIGLVGRIGGGKSTVAARFAELGARVVDADRIAHEVLLDPQAKALVIERFGSGVIAADGSIDRRGLAEQVFGATPAHAFALRDLEAIVHPRVHQRITAILDSCRATEGTPSDPLAGGEVVVLDVPLLVQAGWVDVCDLVVVIQCDDGVRRGRIGARFSPGQIAAREAAWARSLPHAIPERKTRTVDTSGALA